MPGGCVRQIYALLKPGVIFAGSVPNVGGIVAKLRGTKWHLMIPPEHLNYFNERSMKQLLSRFGFEVLFVGTIPLFAAPNFSFGIRAAILRLSRRVSIRPLELVAKRLNRWLTLVKRYIVYKPLNMLIVKLGLGGDNLLFVARKNGDCEVS